MHYKHFLIRPAQINDFSSIKKIVSIVLEEYGLMYEENGKDRDLNDIEENFFKKGGYFGVAEDTNENRIVGTFGFFPLDRNVCELRKMYLVSEVRGKGLGQAILSYAIELCKERNFTKIILETISPLKEAISLYKKFGFVEIIPLEVNNRVDQTFELKIK